MLFLGGIYFFILVILFLYLPGRFLLRVCKFTINDSLIRVPVEAGIGCALFMVSVYFLSWIHSEAFYLLLLLPVIFFEVRHSILHRKKVIFELPLFEMSIILIGSLLALFITGRSGYEINGGMIFNGINAIDGVFHLSLIGNLMHHFPPTHAGLSGISLHGYNFLYDLLVASFAKFFLLNPFDLFFRYFSFFLAIFYGLSSLALARFLKMDIVTTRFFLFLMYFAQGTIFVFNYLHIRYDPGIVQPLENIVDPSVLFSVSLFFLALILLFSMNKKSHIVILGVLLAVIPMIKIYTAFLLFGALGIVTVVSFVINKKEKWYLASVMLLAGVIGGLIYAPINLGIGKLTFSPFLFYTHFFESYAHMNHSDWWMKMLVYFEHKNYLRIIQNYLLLLALFFIPTLSLRLFGLFSVGNMLKKSFYSLQNIFMISAVILGVLIPSFFLQNIAEFVVIQFLWITYFLLLIPAAFGLSSLYRFLPLFGKILLIIFVVGISIPDLLSLLRAYIYSITIIPESTVIIAKEIKKAIPQSEGVLVLNTHEVDKVRKTTYVAPFISAISEHDVYYEPEVLEFLGLDREVAKRKEIISAVDRLLGDCPNKEKANTTLVSLLQNANSNYIMTFEGKPCLKNLPSLIFMSKKGEAALYKLK